MKQDDLPNLKPGDELLAEDINALSKAIRRESRVGGGKYVDERTTGSYGSYGSPRPWVQTIVIVVAVPAVGSIYTVKERYWNNKDEEWQTIDQEWPLDASDLSLVMEVDDRIVAYWDRLRKAFVPTGGMGEVELASAIDFHLIQPLALTDATAYVEVDDYYDGEDPGRYITINNKTAREDYIFEGVVGNKGVAYYNRRKKRYVIWNMQC